MFYVTESADDRPGAASDERIAGLVSRLDTSDSERFDPPAGLWERIETAVAADADQRDQPTLEVGMVLEYRIDADDVVMAVGGSWDDVAVQGDAGDLVAPDYDRTLWSYIGSQEIRDIWQLIVERVRSDGKELRVPLRCDDAGTRRWFEITVTPEAGGTVRFVSVLVFQESRLSVPLLLTDADRDPEAAAVPLCSWCGHGFDGSRWLEIGQLVRESRLLEATTMPPVSYGICPSCR